MTLITFVGEIIHHTSILFWADSRYIQSVFNTTLRSTTTVYCCLKNSKCFSINKLFFFIFLHIRHNNNTHMQVANASFMAVLFFKFFSYLCFLLSIPFIENVTYKISRPMKENESFKILQQFFIWLHTITIMWQMTAHATFRKLKSSLSTNIYSHNAISFYNTDGIPLPNDIWYKKEK